MKYFLLTFNEDYADEFDVPALAVMDENEFQYWKTNKVRLHAYLGNCEGFEDQFPTEVQTGDDCMRLQMVNTSEVTKEFAKTFKDAKLHDLSLCAIFKR